MFVVAGSFSYTESSWWPIAEYETCYKREESGSSYQGWVNFTTDGSSCPHWRDQDQTFTQNFCRNPAGYFDHLGCTVWSRLSCPVPECPSTLNVTYELEAGVILCMRATYKRRCYNVMSSFFGWAHTQNASCEEVFPWKHLAETVMSSYFTLWWQIISRNYLNSSDTIMCLETKIEWEFAHWNQCRFCEEWDVTVANCVTSVERSVEIDRTCQNITMTS